MTNDLDCSAKPSGGWFRSWIFKILCPITELVADEFGYNQSWSGERALCCARGRDQTPSKTKAWNVSRELGDSLGGYVHNYVIPRPLLYD